MARAVFTAVFLAIFYLAKVAINDLAVADGLSDTVQAQLRGEPIRFTTLKPLDSLLTMLVRFFQSILAGKDISLTLFSIFMAGQLLAVYIIVQVEGLRAGNRRRLVSCTTLWGLGAQLVTFGATLPLYFLLYIHTSAIPAARGRDAFADAISVDPVQARAVLGSLTLGVILPTFLVTLPSPSIISQQSQEIFLAIWQSFPLWFGIAQFILAHTIGALGVAPEIPSARSKAKDLRRIYIFTLPVAALTFYGVFGYVWWASNWASEPAIEALRDMFLPTSPWSQARMASVERGTLALLQWDMYCASLATWSWIVYMVYERNGVGGAVIGLGKLVMWSAVVGPGGAALAVIWGRDVRALRDSGGKRKTG